MPVPEYAAAQLGHSDSTVTNPAAPLVAKAIKLAERQDDSRRQPDRLKAKDALDIIAGNPQPDHRVNRMKEWRYSPV